MLTAWQNEIISLLKEWFEDSFGETVRFEHDGITFLRFAPALFTDGSAEVVVEVCLSGYGEELTVAQVYTTMLTDTSKGLEALRTQIPEWNFYSFTGSYGIYEKMGHLYHKHNIALINDSHVDDQAEMVFAGVCLAMDEMARRINDAAALCSE